MNVITHLGLLPSRERTQRRSGSSLSSTQCYRRNDRIMRRLTGWWIFTSCGGWMVRVGGPFRFNSRRSDRMDSRRTRSWRILQVRVTSQLKVGVFSSSGGVSCCRFLPVSACHWLLQVMSLSRRRYVEVCPFLCRTFWGHRT